MKEKKEQSLSLEKTQCQDFAQNGIFYFLQASNNLLYPKEDRVNKILLVACRSCDYEVEAPDFKVYSRNINLSQENDPILATVDLSSDPTYPKILNKCPRCSNNEAVFFQSKSKQKDANMKVILFKIQKKVVFCLL